MRRRTLLAAAGAAAAFGGVAPLRAAEPVDVALVLAVDVSRSIDEEEARLQRDGYRAALTDPAVIEAIRRGTLGAIGLSYVEWAGFEHQRLVMPWTRIAGAEDAAAVSALLASTPGMSVSWTSISGGIDFSRRVLAECPFEATRRVIDVSGDGANNSGRPAELARDEAVEEGITINGLPILNDRPTFGRRPQIPLDIYFTESVIGGPGAFVVVAKDFESFGQAVRRKLIREIAGREGPSVG